MAPAARRPRVTLRFNPGYGCSFPIQISNSRSRSREAFRPRALVAFPPPDDPRARGTPGSSQPAAPIHEKECGGDCSPPRNRPDNPALRARCEWLAPRDPWWTDLVIHHLCPTAGRAGSSRLGPPHEGRPSYALTRPPPPAPRLVTLATRPSGGAGCGDKIIVLDISSRTIFIMDKIVCGDDL
jgi:hypothetical protein